jgi:hypothetical protein
MSEDSENYETHRLQQAVNARRLSEIELELGCPSVPDFLTNFKKISGEADDYPWREWVCSTRHRVIPDPELELIDEAEALISRETSAFGTRLSFLRSDNPELAPIGSDFKIIPWLMLLRDEDDASGADACELYWVVRSGFNLLPPEYSIPSSDCKNYSSATEAESETHMFDELMRAKEAGYLDTWDVIKKECNCEHLSQPHFIHALGMLSKEDPNGVKKLGFTARKLIRTILFSW